MCWGLRWLDCVCVGKSKGINEIVIWTPTQVNRGAMSPQLEALLKIDSEVVIVKGAFKHNACTRSSILGLPFHIFTCLICGAIMETIFELRMVHDECVVDKTCYKIWVAMQS